MSGKGIPFRPKLEGNFRSRFYRVLSDYHISNKGETLEPLCNKEINWVENECQFNIEQRKKYRAIWLFLRDLIRASWKAEFKDGTLMVQLPDVEEVVSSGTSVADVKFHLREWMKDSRIEKLTASSDFIEKMEKGSATKESISALIADGEELAQRLRKAQSGQINISQAVIPYLDLVDNEKPIDPFTGQRKSDIWRYFRMTWSSPAENTPGRTIQYLIRDAAHPMHAVMGIASLENCSVAISCRDGYLGWTVDSFAQKIKDGEISPNKAFNLLLGYLKDGINGIKYSDLVSPEDIDNPSDEVIQRLFDRASAAENERKKLTSKRTHAHDGCNGDPDANKSIDLLFERKRAEQLAKYLNAKRIIEAEILKGQLEETWITFFASDHGMGAVRAALTAQKSKHIGSSMMELNVCGAIPPYNEILGGKLVALLATSPQVINDYRRKYSNRKSEIASQMAGVDIYRPAELVYIGTTSLYSVGSSQYNRLKIPATTFDSGESLEWKRLGKTTGYGTLHISRATTMALKEATVNAGNNVNHVFGEGPSPKMRLLAGAVRELLETSSDDAKEFTKHAMTRIVFGANLAKNTSNYLLGIDSTPEYITDTSNYEEDTNKIIRFWQSRWLAHRIQYEPIYERIISFDKQAFLISNDIAQDDWEFTKLREDATVESDCKKLEGLQFVRNFYRGTSAYADNLDISLIESIHVKTKLDSSILNAVKAGMDVVLTGNPGDGKTHIIRIMEGTLQSAGLAAHIVLDASTKSNEELYQEWKTARKAGVPFIVAINAAVLHSLYSAYPDFHPIQNAYSLMVHAVSFSDDIKNASDVVVFDLSRREILSPEIVKEAINKLTDERHYVKCKNCPLMNSCAVLFNKRLIKNPLFQERLQLILKRLSLEGYHATLRELQAFISYIIFGDRECEKIIATNGNRDLSIANLIYSGKGTLFNAIKSDFDPINVSHPIWDEKILTNAVPAGSWIAEFPVPVESISPDQPEQLYEFYTRKRQFFFFNEYGIELLNILDDDVTKFQEYIAQKDKDLKRTTIKMLNAFFGAKGYKELDTWSAHRFNISARRVLISLGNLREKQFAVGRPKLIESMKSGMEMSNNYIRFELNGAPNIFLKIDYDMFRFLTEAESGVPVLYMNDSSLSKKVWRFMEQLQSRVSVDLNSENYVTISLLDINNKNKYEVEIDIEDGIYKSIKKTTIGH